MEMSELTGINNCKFSLWENGWRRPNPLEIAKIQKVLDVKFE